MGAGMGRGVGGRWGNGGGCGRSSREFPRRSGNRQGGIRRQGQIRNAQEGQAEGLVLNSIGAGVWAGSVRGWGLAWEGKHAQLCSWGWRLPCPH